MNLTADPTLDATATGEEEGFDPMGFSLAIDIRWLREAERGETWLETWLETKRGGDHVRPGKSKGDVEHFGKTRRRAAAVDK